MKETEKPDIITENEQSKNRHAYFAATYRKCNLFAIISIIGTVIILFFVGGKTSFCGIFSEENPNDINIEQRDSILSALEHNMVWIEGGTFTMGASNDNDSDVLSDEKPAHQVKLSGYFLCKYEVTQELWKAVMGTTVTDQLEIIGSMAQHSDVGANYPMYLVSWEECQEFISKLNYLTGKSYRLPTEAEWEFAARGGNKSRGYKYSGSNNVDLVAWYMDNSGISGTHIIGQKNPNELGLYDMSGNVSEWCQDVYGNYSAEPQTDPIGPSIGSERIIRSGCECLPAWSCRVSDRGHDISSRRDSDVGFRLASDID